VSWLHDVLPTLDRIVEPVVAATRLPDVPASSTAFRASRRPCAAAAHDRDVRLPPRRAEELLQPLAPPEALAARAPLGPRCAGLTSIAEENAAQAIQNPEDHRYAVDCTWSDATAAELAPVLRELWGGLPTEHSFSIWYGWAPVRELPDMAFLDRGRRVPRDVRDLDRSGPTTRDIGLGVHARHRGARGGRRRRPRRLPRRHGLHAPARPLPQRRALRPGWRGSRAAREPPTAGICSYLIADGRDAQRRMSPPVGPPASDPSARPPPSEARKGDGRRDGRRGSACAAAPGGRGRRRRPSAGMPSRAAAVSVSPGRDPRSPRWPSGPSAWAQARG